MFAPSPSPNAPSEIDRVFVRYRGDESWASVAFEVVRGNNLYRSTDPLHLFDRAWAEQELRWPGGEGSRLSSGIDAARAELPQVQLEAPPPSSVPAPESQSMLALS